MNSVIDVLNWIAQDKQHFWGTLFFVVVIAGVLRKGGDW